MENTGYDYLATIKRTVGDFKVGGVYWCGSKFIRFDPYFANLESTSIIPRFTDQKKLLLVRGGIGDLLALSILCDVTEEVTVLTTKSLFPVLDWWEKIPRKKHFQEPLWTIKYPNKLADVVKSWGQASGDEIIAQGSKENWYEIISRSVDRPFLGGRPKLRKLIPEESNRFLGRTILIIHKATSVNRSAEIGSLLRATIKANKETGEQFRICWYDEGGKDYGQRLLREADQSLGNTTLKQYLADLYYADFVISVDTSAIHFREGIEKPALGIYSSFSAESRTKHYQFTRSIDVKSPCQIQPCFMNFTQCPVAQKDDKYAPCLGPDNPDFETQIKNELCKYLQDGASAWLAMSKPSATLSI